MGMGVNPVLAGAAGGTASSVAGRFLAGDPLTGLDSFAQTGFGAITGAGFGLLGSQFPSEVGKRVFVGLGSGTASQAGKTYSGLCWSLADRLTCSNCAGSSQSKATRQRGPDQYC